MATVTKDMWVENLVEPWRGNSNSMPVIEFFESINEAAEIGRLSSKDKVRLARLYPFSVYVVTFTFHYQLMHLLIKNTFTVHI